MDYGPDNGGESIGPGTRPLREGDGTADGGGGGRDGPRQLVKNAIDEDVASGEPPLISVRGWMLSGPATIDQLHVQQLRAGASSAPPAPARGPDKLNSGRTSIPHRGLEPTTLPIHPLASTSERPVARGGPIAAHQ